MKRKKSTGFKIKNHVSRKAKRVAGMLKGRYGIGLDTFDKAIRGDQNAIKLIGEAGKQGALVQEIAPLLEEAYINAIKGTEQYNKSVSNIIKQGATSGINIDKAVSQAALANRKYIHQRLELKKEYVAARDAEDLRHQYQVNYIELKTTLDRYFQKVDGNIRQIEQTNRPELAQLNEDNRYQTVATKHLLQHGNDARLDLLPRKEYVSTDENKPQSKVMAAVNRVRSALGF